MRISLLLACFCAGLSAAAQLQTPGQFLAHPYGAQFTRHHELVDYVRHVAANSPRVQLEEYGRTYEGRPLLLVTVSSPANLAQAENIQADQRRAAGLADGSPTADGPAVVWLSFSVHGNEAAAAEASMAVLYALADPTNTRTEAWLDNTVVLIDPAVNPDGYDRYTHWYRSRAHLTGPQADPTDWAHHEPWPSGRVNHYLFDLNRDWAWATQIETRQRLPRYHAWLPHIHADFHEQGIDAPYYFAPAAAPFHAYITAFQGRFQETIGRNNAGYFDERGWLYFTKEVFDLLYPSYGDTYPTFNGAVGMTYEQGGSGRAGRAIRIATGDTLTLADRIAHHTVTALSTVEVAAQNATELRRQFAAYFTAAADEPPGNYAAYLIARDNAPDRLARLTELLDRHDIRYYQLIDHVDANGFDYTTGRPGKVRGAAGDLLVPARQPMGTLVQVLFEPATALRDSLTYDITAWSLPYAYGLHTVATTEAVKEYAPYSTPPGSATPLPAAPYAYLLPWTGLDAARFAGEALRRDLRLRSLDNPATYGGTAYGRGSLVLTRADNRKVADFDERVRAAATAANVQLHTTTTGLAETGADLGSARQRLLTAPKVLLVGGEATNANDFGHLWHYFEQELHYPITVVEAARLDRVSLADYDVLIWPNGRYDFSDAQLEKVRDWVRGGGTLVAIQGALRSLAGQSGFALDTPLSKVEPAEGERYADRERRGISAYNPGAIFRVELDSTHPLAYGLPDPYATLKSGTARYAQPEGIWSVGTLPAAPQITGFVGQRIRADYADNLVFGVEDTGRGHVVYLTDNPVYRGFWEVGKLLLANAVFQVD